MELLLNEYVIIYRKGLQKSCKGEILMEHSMKKGLVWVLVALILSLGLLSSAWVVTSGVANMRRSENTIGVTGSAKKQITSDLIVWKGMFSTDAKQLVDAYAMLEVSQEKVKSYLLDKGFEEKDIVFSSISTRTNYVMHPNGMYSDEISSYRLEQTVEIKSNEVEKVTDVSRESTELINEGVYFQSLSPQYFYTQIADLKISMLAEATKDAKLRAEQISQNTDTKIGKLRSASMGVFQITPVNSNEVSDYGINDTYSLEKEITAVVNCSFEVK